jgi:CheY-like chemotaxis protein
MTGNDAPSSSPSSGRNHFVLAELGRVTGELLHDIIGTMGTLSAHIELAQADAAAGQPVEPGLERIRADYEHLRAMVRDVFEELRGRVRTPRTSFDPAATVQDEIARFLLGAPAVNVRFRSRAREGARVLGRASFFARSVANLLRNAARHAREEIRLEMGNRGDVLWLTVEDDGDGISDELAATLFEPFEHGGHGGTGLGLSLVRWATERLGGGVRLLPNGKLGGACFEITLPLFEPEPARAPAASGSEPRLSGWSVALVEDDPSVRRVYDRLLRRDGATTHLLLPPGSYPDVSALAEHLGEVAPDAILLDLRLGPFRGEAVWQALATQVPALAERVVFLSGETWEQGDLCGRPVLSKLLDWPDVRRAIEGCLPH